MSANAELEEILTHCDYTMKIAFDLLEQHRKEKLSAARAQTNHPKCVLHQHRCV